MDNRQLGQWLTSLISIGTQTAYSAGQADTERRINKDKYQLEKEKLAHEQAILEKEQAYFQKQLEAKQQMTSQQDRIYKDIALYVGIFVVVIGTIITGGVLYADKKKRQKKKGEGKK